MSAPPNRLRVNGTTLDYDEHGSGTPVILLHGAPSDRRMWTTHCAALAPRFRAIAYTQRYFGAAPQSEGPPFGVRVHAADLVGFIDELGAGPAHVVAWSYAGHVALTAALEQPQRFRSLFVIEPGVPSYVTAAEELDAIAADARSFFDPVFAAVAAGDHAAAVRALLDGSGQRAGYFASQPAERQRVQLDNAHVLPRLLLQQEPPPPLSCEQLRRLQPRTTVAWGTRTRPFFGVVARAAARCIPGTRHAAIPDATHMWPEERPEELVALAERCFAEN